MIVKKDNYQIEQKTGEAQVKIFKQGTLYKNLKSKPNLTYNELLKILELYQND